MIDFIENLLLLIANRIRNDGKSCGHIFHPSRRFSLSFGGGIRDRYLIYNDKLKRVEEKVIITFGGKTLEGVIY